MKKLLVITLCISILTGLSACGITREPGQFDEFAQCMTDQGFVIYHTDACPYCKAQEAAFKGSFDLINSVECTQSPLDCMDADIEGYPTWVFEGKKYPGKRSLSELAELSKCDLKNGSDDSEDPGAENTDDSDTDAVVVPDPEVEVETDTTTE